MNRQMVKICGKSVEGMRMWKNLNLCKDANISINDFATRILITYEHKTWQMGKTLNKSRITNVKCVCVYIFNNNLTNRVLWG